MPAGEPWLIREPTWFSLPTEPLYRVHLAQYDATSPNPNTRARFALPGTHAMLYAADSLEGALWEALLRYVVIPPGGRCVVPSANLKGQVVSRVKWVGAEARVLPLSRPGLLHLFPDGDGPAVAAVKAMTTTADHASTHPEAAALLNCLQGLTPPVTEMPILSWKSRQFEDSTVYLSYHEPGAALNWVQEGPSKALDTPAGMLEIQDALRKHHFHWTPLNTLPPSAIEDP